jgi:hypothetical protein
MEIWHKIKDFPSYEVSNLGRFKKPDGKIRKWDYSANKYITVRVRNSNACTLKLLHILVIEAFIDRPNYKCEVNHKDGNKSNNCLDNLEYTTHKDNIKHAIKTGLIKYLSGSGHPLYGIPLSKETKDKIKAAHQSNGLKRTNYKLTDSQVYEIKKRRFEGSDMESLAIEFKQTAGNISLICAGKRRSNISPEYNTIKKIPKRRAKRTHFPI